jgi:sugar lactone lactonase YvrE
MYWADAAKPVTIKKRSPAGAITTHARGDFRSIERMTATPDGTLYLLDAGDVRRVSPSGVVSTVVRGLTGTGRPAAEVAELNHHMGIWTDGAGRIYVAAARERLVLRVTPAGQVETVARSAAPWSPSGGLVDNDGSLWILEYDSANASRVRRVDRTGQERIFIVPARSWPQAVSKN